MAPLLSLIHSCLPIVLIYSALVSIIFFFFSRSGSFTWSIHWHVLQFLHPWSQNSKCTLNWLKWRKTVWSKGCATCAVGCFVVARWHFSENVNRNLWQYPRRGLLLLFVSYFGIYEKINIGPVMSCVCDSTWPAAECEKDDAREIFQMFGATVPLGCVGFTQSELSLMFSRAWKARSTGLSMCVTQKWVSSRLCNSGITVCGTKQAVMDQRVCVLDTFSLH